MRPPDYSGRGLVNLVAELERRLTGTAPSPGLHPEPASVIPTAPTYLLVLLDGLGDAQLSHPIAAPLLRDRRAAIEAGFPTTTTVSLATVATGLPPAGHGLLGYQLWLPEVGEVVNTLKWITLWGKPVALDFADFLPRPNTWERLVAAGVEPIVLQPLGFMQSSLTRVLYRGCRREAYSDMAEAVAAAKSLTAQPGRLVFLYLPQVDFAAHVSGQESPEYAAALRQVAGVWEAITARLPRGVAVVGTSDHGHLDVPADRRAFISRPDHEGRTFFGDSRVLFVRGQGASLAEQLPATWLTLEEMAGWWGPGPPHPRFSERAPDGALFADPGWALLHRHSDERLVGQHGGLTPEEVLVPVLTAGG
jgi:hypothetical protein